MKVVFCWVLWFERRYLVSSVMQLGVFSPVKGLGQLEWQTRNWLTVNWQRGECGSILFFRLSLRPIVDKRACLQTNRPPAPNPRGVQFSLLGPLGG